MEKSSGNVIALIGAVLLGFGVLMPVMHVPLRGNASLLDLGWAGVAIVACSAAAALLVLLGWARQALWAGLAALGLLAAGYMRASGEIAASRERVGELGLGSLRDIGNGNLTLKSVLRDVAVSDARLEWGWAVPVLGAVLVIAGAALAWRRRPS